jgi:hypothetical protein
MFIAKNLVVLSLSLMVAVALCPSSSAVPVDYEETFEAENDDGDSNPATLTTTDEPITTVETTTVETTTGETTTGETTTGETTTGETTTGETTTSETTTGETTTGETTTDDGSTTTTTPEPEKPSPDSATTLHSSSLVACLLFSSVAIFKYL